MSAITKVFGILKTIIAYHWCGLACFEVVTKTRAPKPTAHRLLETLVRLDYLPYDGETKKHFGGLKFASLGCRLTFRSCQLHPALPNEMAGRHPPHL
jgi:DNA-binding IclR family transcriptional regulator